MENNGVKKGVFYYLEDPWASTDSAIFFLLFVLLLVSLLGLLVAVGHIYIGRVLGRRAPDRSIEAGLGLNHLLPRGRNRNRSHNRHRNHNHRGLRNRVVAWLCSLAAFLFSLLGFEPPFTVTPTTSSTRSSATSTGSSHSSRSSRRRRSPFLPSPLPPIEEESEGEGAGNEEGYTFPGGVRSRPTTSSGAATSVPASSTSIPPPPLHDTDRRGRVESWLHATGAEVTPPIQSNVVDHEVARGDFSLGGVQESRLAQRRQRRP